MKLSCKPGVLYLALTFSPTILLRRFVLGGIFDSPANSSAKRPSFLSWQNPAESLDELIYLMGEKEFFLLLILTSYKIFISFSASLSYHFGALPHLQ